MDNEFDIVVVGGGLSGGCLALSLARAGIKVAVVEAVSDEQRVNSPAGNRALVLSYGSACLMADLDLWDDVSQQATPIKKIHISDSGRFGKARLSAEREQVDALGYVIAARILEQKIASALIDSSAELICPASVVGLETFSETVRLDLQGEVSKVSVKARLLVGADGGNSAVRRLLNLGQESYEYHQSAIVTSVKPEVDPMGTAYERFTRSGPLAMLPISNGHCSVVWTRKIDETEALMAMDDDEFIAQLQQCFGFYLGHLSALGRRIVLPLKLVRANGITAHRCVLVGNAVHQLHPVAGQGFNLGMRDLAVLSDLITDCCSVGDDPGANGLLSAYETARKKDHDRVVGFTDGVVRLFSNDWWPVSAMRGAGLLGLDYSPVSKRFFTRYAMGVGGEKET